MTIWIVALILWVFCALLGHKQGAIRAAISFVGIIISGLLAWPLSGLVARLMRLVVHHPLVIYTLSPIITFVILLAIFKSVGFSVHRKIWVAYQYGRDDLRMAHWLRVNRRVGMAIGFLNAFLYLVLISVPIYNLSYWTMQIAPSDQESSQIKLLNRMGQDLQSTGMGKVACAIDPLPKTYFKSADLAGLIVQNPQLASRLAAYPPFLSLAERTDFVTLGEDAGFTSIWQSHGPFSQIWVEPQFQSMRQDPATADMLWTLVEANLDDLTAYLHTGQSAKYDAEPILGRWDVNVTKSLQIMLRTQINVPSGEMANMRVLWQSAYSNAVFVAAADNQAFFDNYPHFTVKDPSQKNDQSPPFTTVNLQGSWQSGDSYGITLSGNGVNKTGMATIEDSGMTLKIGDDRLVLERQSN